MKKKIVIVGAGGFGRELSSWILASKEKYPDWELTGFLDDNKDALKGYHCEFPIIGSAQEYLPSQKEFLVMGIGSPKIKRSIVNSLEAHGAQFLSFIHGSSIFGTNVSLGRGCILCPYTILTSDVIIGDFVTINCFSGAGHDVSIGAFSTVSGHVDITGFAKIGESVLIGSNASILPNVYIEDNSIIGAGSIVVKKVKKGTTVFGNPAKVIFDNSSSEE